MAGGAVGGAGGSAELYDPVTVTFTATGSMTVGRYHTATLLHNGKVLIAGGFSGPSISRAPSCTTQRREIHGHRQFDAARERHTATLLQNGKVLIAGGSGADEPRERRAVRPSGRDIRSDRQHDRGTVQPHGDAVANGKVLVAGGR